MTGSLVVLGGKSVFIERSPRQPEKRREYLSLTNKANVVHDFTGSTRCEYVVEVFVLLNEPYNYRLVSWVLESVLPATGLRWRKRVADHATACAHEASRGFQIVL